MGKDNPYSMGIFETIVNVHFGEGLYLIVVYSGDGESDVFGLSAAPPVHLPTFTTSKGDGVKLIDTATPPHGDNSTSGPSGCFVYPKTEDPNDAWAFGGHVNFPAVDGACPWPGGVEDPEAFVIPCNDQKSVTTTRIYLYSIPSADASLLTLDVSKIMPHFISDYVPSPGPNVQTQSNGSASFHIYVYSTVKGKVSKVTDLLDFHFDGKPRPTEDDSYTMQLTSENEGTFIVSVAKDEDPADAQIDNYGDPYQPYKIRVHPNIGVDHIPDQPPPHLPPPR